LDDIGDQLAKMGAAKKPKANSLTTVNDIEGRTFSAKSDDGEQKVSFTFLTAEKGKFTLNTQPKPIPGFIGFVVKIQAKAEGFKYSEFRVIQIERWVDVDGNSVDPAQKTPTQIGYSRLGGYGSTNNATTNSQGWFVDSSDKTSGYFGMKGDAEGDWVRNGTKDKALVMGDAPGSGSVRSVGMEFQTYLVGVDNGIATALGYLQWGFYINGDGSVYTDTPVAHLGSTYALGDALERWNASPTKTKLTVGNVYPTPPVLQRAAMHAVKWAVIASPRLTSKFIDWLR
jgi:hypothetical protein